MHRRLSLCATFPLPLRHFEHGARSFLAVFSGSCGFKILARPYYALLPPFRGEIGRPRRFSPPDFLDTMLEWVSSAHPRATLKNRVALSPAGVAAEDMAPKRIALYGNFGAGNFGNECTLQVVAEQLRRRWPDVQLTCLCTIPDDVRSRHGMRAVRASLAASDWSWADLDREEPKPPAAPPRARRLPLMRALRKLIRLAFRRVPRELLHWIQGFAVLVHCDVLIVPGTQVVSDYLCGPSGWPYDIFKWSTLARLCRVDVVFLSVGVGPIHHPLSRWLISRSLACAKYRSYRDRESQRTAELIGLPARRDPIYPDLAFGLAAQSLPPTRPRSRVRRIIGIGLKNQSGAGDGAEGDRSTRYLDTLADFIARLHERNYGVRLLIGDLQYDLKPRNELIEVMRRKGIATQPPQLLVDDPRSVEELLHQLEDTDAVISARLHNLVLALLLGRPVIALSDHSKLDSLLAELGLGYYRVALEPLQLDALLERFESLELNAERLMAHTRNAMERYRGALEEQYARVFAGDTDGRVSMPRGSAPGSPADAGSAESQ